MYCFGSGRVKVERGDRPQEARQCRGRYVAVPEIGQEESLARQEPAALVGGEWGMDRFRRCCRWRQTNRAWGMGHGTWYGEEGLLSRPRVDACCPQAGGASARFEPRSACVASPGLFLASCSSKPSREEAFLGQSCSLLFCRVCRQSVCRPSLFCFVWCCG